jgi:hypothetical protein
MERLTRLFPLRAFGRLRHLRGLVPCGTFTRAAAAFDAMVSAPGLAAVQASPATSTAESPMCDRQGTTELALPSGLPAFSRVPLRQGVPQVASPARQSPRGNDLVRIYRGPSRLVLVGHIDAVCNMIDRYIAAEGAGVAHGLID